MNSPSSLSRLGAIAVFALTFLLSACGQKGPLYLQAEPAPASAASSAAIPDAAGKPAGTPPPAAQ